MQGKKTLFSLYSMTKFDELEVMEKARQKCCPLGK